MHALLDYSLSFFCRRVHISEATRKVLGDQFNLEHGNGQERDDYLKEKDVTTWLVDVPEVLSIYSTYLRRVKYTCT